MPTFSVGSKDGAGFSLIELLLALTIAGLVMAAAFPASKALMESMQYRSAVRNVAAMLGQARLKAVTTGQAQDVSITPAKSELRSGDKTLQLPSSLSLVVQSARQLNRNDTGVIRFYPQGDTSGGSVEIQRSSGGGSVVSVDWLLGAVRVKASNEG